MEVEVPGALSDITEAVINQMAAKGKELSKTRKKRVLPETLATPDNMRAMAEKVKKKCGA